MFLIRQSLKEETHRAIALTSKEHLLREEKEMLEFESKEFNITWPNLLYFSRNQWKRKISKEAWIYIEM